MGRNQVCRPRTTYEERNRLQRFAADLNGREDGVRSFNESLKIVLRYLEILDEAMACRACGSELVPFEIGDRRVRGKYCCPECHDRGEWLTVWDYLNPDDRENARLPALPSEVAERFAAADAGGGSGTKPEHEQFHGNTRQFDAQLDP